MRIVDDCWEFTEGGGIVKKVSTIFFNPCFHSVCLYRLSNLLYRAHLSVFSKLIWYLNRVLFCVDIDYRADLAGGFFLVHGLGTVIGKSVISKGRLRVYQHVTIGGGNGKPDRKDADGELRGMPLFLGDTVIYAGAIIVGGITVSANTIIKAGSLVKDNI